MSTNYRPEDKPLKMEHKNLTLVRLKGAEKFLGFVENFRKNLKHKMSRKRSTAFAPRLSDEKPANTVFSGFMSKHFEANANGAAKNGKVQIRLTEILLRSYTALSSSFLCSDDQ